MLGLLRRFLTLTGLMAAGGLCVWLAYFSPYLRFSAFEVRGNARAATTELRHLANLPEGAPLVTLDLDAAVEGILRHPWVQSAEARRQFPGTVVISVKERVAVAIIQLDQLYLVDDQGDVFTRALPGDLDHPYLTGLDSGLAETQPELSRRLVRDGLEWLSALQHEGKIAEQDISEVHFSASTGYSILLRNGGEIVLGFSDHARAARLAVLASSGLDFASPHRVDLASDRLAVVTPI